MLPLLLLAPACGEQVLQTVDDEVPTLTITAPADTERFWERFDTVTACAVAADAEDGLLPVTWELDGAEASFDSDEGCAGGETGGVLTAPAAGEHTLTASALDSRDHPVSAQALFAVIADDPPTADIGEPQGQSVVSAGTVRLSGVVRDAVTLVPEARWSSDLAGDLGASSVATDGNTSAEAQLGVGVHVITLTATDERDQTGTDSVQVEVR